MEDEDDKQDFATRNLIKLYQCSDEVKDCQNPDFLCLKYFIIYLSWMWSFKSVWKSNFSINSSKLQPETNLKLYWFLIGWKTSYNRGQKWTLGAKWLKLQRHVYHWQWKPRNLGVGWKESKSGREERSDQKCPRLPQEKRFLLWKLTLVVNFF